MAEHKQESSAHAQQKRAVVLEKLLLQGGLPVLAVAAVVVLQLLLLRPMFAGHAAFLLLLAAVATSAWFGGFWTGLIATAVSALAAHYLLLSPNSSEVGDAVAQNLSIFIFVVEAAALSFLGAAVRLSKQRVSAQRLELQEHEARAGLLAESVKDCAVCGLDVEGRVASWSAGAERLQGYTEQEIKGERFSKFYEPADVRKGLPDRALRIARESGRYEDEVRRVRQDGSTYPAHILITSLKDDGGSLRGYLEIARDLSERKRAEEALRESEARFQTLADAAPVMIWIMGPEKQCHYLNAAWRDFTGRTLAQEQGDGWMEGIHPQDMQVYLAAFDQAFERRQDFHLEFRLRGADGEYRWVSCHGVPRRSHAAGEFAGYIGTCSDTTGARRGEKEREQLLCEIMDHRGQLEAVLRQMPAGVLIAEAPTGRIILANNQLDQIWRHSPATAERHKHTFEYKGFHATGKPYQLEDWPLIRSLRTGEFVIDEEIEFERGDGTRGTMFVSSSPMRDAEKRIVAAVATFNDTTARKTAERDKAQIYARERMARREAEAANRIKDEFLATLSHELRTPLTSILGWVKMLRTNTLDEASIARALETIQRSAQSQAGLIDELLDVSRVMAGKLRLDVKQMELAPILEAAVVAGKPAADAKSINVQLMLEEDAGHVMGDADRLHQVFWNLLSNAIKFTPKDGHVAIRLRRDNSNLEASVSDTGIGIEKAFLPHVFERFRQADSTNTRAHSGLGLGLAIVKYLVELHGGTVAAESHGTGQGALFRVTLPLVAAAATTTPARREAADGERSSKFLFGAKTSDQNMMLAGVRVLVVDDEAETLKLLTVVLQKYGATVISVSSAKEALEQFKTARPDVLVSDVHMPGESGYDLISKVRALGAEQGGTIPAAALTAYAGVEERMRALLAGFQIHVPKPVEPAELAAVVATLTGRSGQV